MATAVLEPEVQQFEIEKQQALSVAERAKAITVHNNETLTIAGEMLRAVVEKGKQWAALIKPAKDAAHDAHKRVCTLEKTVAEPLTLMENHLRRQISTYSAEQERIRCAEEARLRREAEEQARKEAEERQLQEAIAAEQNGNKEAAEQILAAPVEVVAPPIVLEKTVPKIAGVSTRKVFKFRVVNEALVPREFLMVDESKLRKYGNAMGEQAKVAGVEFYAEDSVVVR